MSAPEKGDHSPVEMNGRPSFKRGLLSKLGL
jgi:hypothetical protein